MDGVGRIFASEAVKGLNIHWTVKSLWEEDKTCTKRNIEIILEFAAIFNWMTLSVRRPSF